MERPLSNLRPFGPFVSANNSINLQTDDKKRDAENAIRKTVTKLDEITGAGKVDVVINGISHLSQGRPIGVYDSSTEDIEVSFEVPFMAITEGQEFKQYLKAVVAHEYTHHIISRSEKLMKQAFWNTVDHNLFNYQDMRDTIEFYDYPQEQYISYSSNKEFLNHLEQFKHYSGARPVEGYANTVGVRHANMSFVEYSDTKTDVREQSSKIQEQHLKGEVENLSFPEVLRLGW